MLINLIKEAITDEDNADFSVNVGSQNIIVNENSYLQLKSLFASIDKPFITSEEELFEIAFYLQGANATVSRDDNGASFALPYGSYTLKDFCLNLQNLCNHNVTMARTRTFNDFCQAPAFRWISPLVDENQFINIKIMYNRENLIDVRYLSDLPTELTSEQVFNNKCALTAGEIETNDASAPIADSIATKFVVTTTHLPANKGFGCLASVAAGFSIGLIDLGELQTLVHDPTYGICLPQQDAADCVPAQCCLYRDNTVGSWVFQYKDVSEVNFQHSTDGAVNPALPAENGDVVSIVFANSYVWAFVIKTGGSSVNYWCASINEPNYGIYNNNYVAFMGTNQAANGVIFARNPFALTRGILEDEDGYISENLGAIDTDNKQLSLKSPYYINMGFNGPALISNSNVEPGTLYSRLSNFSISPEVSFYTLEINGFGLLQSLILKYKENPEQKNIVYTWGDDKTQNAIAIQPPDAPKLKISGIGRRQVGEISVRIRDNFDRPIIMNKSLAISIYIGELN